MKYLTILTLALMILLGTSCDRDQQPRKVASHGKDYEIIVVATQEKWDGEVGDTLRSILLEEVEGLNSREPLFDILRILPNSFNGLITKHHNILNVVTGADYAEPQMNAVYDVYAAPQLIVNVTGPSERSIIEYMSEHRAQLQAIFSYAERDRAVANVERYGNRQLEREISEKFGFTIKLPKGFKVRNQLQDFMWLSYEYPQASQGMIIYTYPYSDRQNFTVDSLAARRDQFVSLVPGERPGSHMVTYPGFIPQVSHMRINGRYWAEMRGFWDVKNDFMGGPFVSYSTLDTENRRVVTIDCYVYSPSPYKHKRNLLRQLENFMYTVSFDEDGRIIQDE